jgi:hypothetical protein
MYRWSGLDEPARGQSAADFAARADDLAHGSGVVLCRVRAAKAGGLVLEFVHRAALVAIRRTCGD